MAIMGIYALLRCPAGARRNSMRYGMPLKDVVKVIHSYVRRM